MKSDFLSIDLVYLWVDGSDPKWLKNKERFLDRKINLVGRYQNNQELKYSLRSVEKHLPWIRKIFIVTDNQIPSFLNVNHSKIHIIHHSEIIPKKYLPSFNSSVIEHFIYKIPELSEHFLFSNDDMFVNADLEQSFFFRNEIPVMRMLYDPLIKKKLVLKRFFKKKINTYRLAIENAYNLFYDRFGVFYSVKEHHNIHAFLKSDYKYVIEDIFGNDLKSMYFNRFRHKSDIHRILVNYYGIHNKRGILKNSDRKESCRIRVHKTNYQRYIDKYNPKLFCLNDSEHATDKDRAHVEPFLKKLFPEKASFEK